MKIFTIILVSLLCGAAQAADLLREARIAAQIEDAILDGEAIRLKAGEAEFLAIHTESDSDKRQGAVILLHGRGANPDWQDVIQPLRIRLTEHGWDTLSIQLPVAAAGAPSEDWQALIPEAAPRITAAADYLRKQNQLNLVLVAHSLGSRMGAEYLASGQAAKEFQAFVAVGMSADTSQPESKTLGALRKIQLPTLDIYGERDLASVKSSAKARRMAARAANNSAYQQLEIPGADHFFNGLDDLLVSRVRAWLAKTAQGKEITAEGAK